MKVRFYNSLTRTVEDFVPQCSGRVGMYTCGPTVYNFAHIGNYRAYIFEDLLRRVLQWAGFNVMQVMNLTDVDDKTIRGALEQGVSLESFTKPFKTAFFEDSRTLAIEPAEVYPAATEHIPEMIALIQRLIDKQHAYVSDDGSVYYSIASFAQYGKLAHLDRAGLRSGARVAQDEYEKETLADFALWKAWSEEDGEVAWDSPWGRGRPGWHIECSAMSMKYLGETFDIHTGGVDNLFPHHENEIAQSEGATGKPFVAYWLHNAHLMVEGHKMAKSLGNFYTLRQLIDKGYSGREIRYVLVSAHYRQTLNFTFTAVDAARTALGRIDDFVERLCAVAGDTGVDATPVPEWASRMHADFARSVSLDLGIPGALAALFDLIHAGNRHLDNGTLMAQEAEAVLAILKDMDRVFGFIFACATSDGVDTEASALLELRQAARRNKDFAEADRLREQLADMGWEVRDTAEGPKLKRRSPHHG